MEILAQNDYTAELNYLVAADGFCDIFQREKKEPEILLMHFFAVPTYILIPVFDNLGIGRRERL